MLQDWYKAAVTLFIDKRNNSKSSKVIYIIYVYRYKFQVCFD